MTSNLLNLLKHHSFDKRKAIALAGQPPVDVAEELKDLFIQINLQRYLERKGVQLADDQLQLLTCE